MKLANNVFIGVGKEKGVIVKCEVWENDQAAFL